MQTFRVHLNSWDSYSLTITALTKEAAEAEAQKLWDDVGPEAFSHRDCGVDYLDAELCPRQWGEQPTNEKTDV